MNIQFVFLWSDLLIYILLITLAVFVVQTSRSKHWQDTWKRVGYRKSGMISLVFLLAYTLVALLDSIHFKITAHPTLATTASSYRMQSALDAFVSPLGTHNEITYSAPFALYSSARSTACINGKVITYYPRLHYAGIHVHTLAGYHRDIFHKVARALLVGLALSCLLFAGFIYSYAQQYRLSFLEAARRILSEKIAWREILITCALIITVACFIKLVSPYYHILGTNKIGEDTLYETLKSIRTGLIIGTLTTLVMLPFAILLGAQAGYYSGWRDDLIQYIYTTLSSVPAVLLITAAVLALQVFIANHAQLFPTLEGRADVRLLSLCIILGITSWTGLCRLLRAETLKLREMDYVKAAVAMGVHNLQIIGRHIVPNMMHILLITIVLDFSSLVLAEAVLSYVGVGVDPITPSWGNMINSARLDLAREPIVWWPFLAAFIFMFILVLSANLFADAVRDAFDPRLRNEFNGSSTH